MEAKKTCFVVQGFGKKTDYKTGRSLDLDASYEVIKEAVEDAGLVCVRADEIQHAGLIDKPMYEQILKADLVIADLSTSNVNAVYELGVRHALRPRTTIIVAESQFDFAFDINRNLIRTYEHLGEDLGRREAKRFATALTEAITAVINDQDAIDSPLYTFVPYLQPPTQEPTDEATPFEAHIIEEASTDPPAKEPPVRALMQQAQQAIEASNFRTAKGILQGIHALKPHDEYVIQQMALATYKSQHPTPEAALREAKLLLNTINPHTSHDTESLGIWGAIHKRLWNITADVTDLNEAIFAHEKGFYLRRDYYNGINYAFLLNVRASLAEQTPADAITDFILAQRVRREVIEIGEAYLAMLLDYLEEDPPEESSGFDEERYWLLATLWEAAVGIGDMVEAARWKEKAVAAATADWMLNTTETQLQALEAFLTNSPLQFIRA